MKAVIDTLEGLSDEVKAEYEPKDGKFHLKVEGQLPGYVDAKELLAANTKVVEFRDRNIALLKENDELRPLKLKYEGIDPAEAKDAIEKVKALGKKGIKDVEDFNAQVKAVAEDLIKPLREQLAMSAAETAEARKRADDSLLHAKISEAFVKAGGKPGATDYVVGLSKDDFEVKDGKLVAKAGKFSKTKPAEPLTPEEWLADRVQKEHDYVFNPSNGGGAQPTIKSGPVASKNRPDVKILKNPTPQELGQYSGDIASGKMKVEFETAT
jgi:hypothetical protein